MAEDSDTKLKTYWLINFTLKDKKLSFLLKVKEAFVNLILLDQKADNKVNPVFINVAKQY